MALAASAALAYPAAYLAIEYGLLARAGVRFVLQGRYYLPGLAPQLLLVLLAWEAPLPPRWCPLAGLAHPAAMIALNWYALFVALVPRYVGADPAAPLGIAWARLTALAPDFSRPGLLIALFLLALAAQAAWLLAAGLAWPSAAATEPRMRKRAASR